MSTPPLPAGYALDSAPPLPPGYNLDSGEQKKPGILDKANEYAGKALSAAGLPTSLSNIPEWLQHLTGTHKDSQPFWEPIRKAIKEPTQENIVAAVPFVGPASVAMSKDVQAGNYGGAAATLAGTIGGAKMAGQVEPGLNAAAQAVGLPEKMQGAANRLYQSALKPPPGSTSTAKVASAIKTGLNEEIPVSASGVDKLQGLVEDLNSKIQDTIKAGATQGATVNKYAVTSRLAGTAKKFATQVNPESDLATVSESGNEFLRNQPTDIPAADAQALKSGTYQQLKGKSYGELKSATIESQKALARGIKEELATQFPEIGGMNAREGQLLGLDPLLERAVRRIDNHDIISLGTATATGAGAIAGGGVGAVAAGILKKVVEDPLIKSRLAIILNRKGTIPYSTAEAKVAAYVNALANASPVGGEASANQTSGATNQ